MSDYEPLFSVLNAFTVGTEEYYPKCNNVNDAKGLQILYHYYCNINLWLEVANHKYWLITGTFQIQVNLVLCTVGSD